MRKLSLAALSTALAGILTGCAANGAGPGIGARESAELRRDCEARGGVLIPSGAATGRPALDEVCRITDPTRQAR